MFIMNCQVPLGPSIKCSLLYDHEGIHVDYSQTMCWTNPEKVGDFPCYSKTMGWTNPEKA